MSIANTISFLLLQNISDFKKFFINNQVCGIGIKQAAKFIIIFVYNIHTINIKITILSLLWMYSVMNAGIFIFLHVYLD